MIAAREAIAQLEFMLGPPTATAIFKKHAKDFCVTEDLGFELSGEGEHHCFQIRKTELSTPQVVRQLAQAAGVKEHDIGYAGLKDRMGVCVQWFSVYQPHQREIDTSALESENLEILQRTRNSRKIRRGSHKRNEFVIRLRDIDPQAGEGLAQRLQVISVEGVPNYFGEQRFGNENSNVKMAHKLFAGSLKLRRGFQKGMLLSAARSFVFNELLSLRVGTRQWNTYISGDVMNLAGTESVFVPQLWDDTLQERLHSADIHPTGALWGDGDLRTRDEARAVELAVAQEHSALCQGLQQAGVKQARRSLRLIAEALRWQFIDNDLEVRFALPPGAYATSVLREVCGLKEAIDE